MSLIVTGHSRQRARIARIPRRRIGATRIVGRRRLIGAGLYDAGLWNPVQRASDYAAEVIRDVRDGGGGYYTAPSPASGYYTAPSPGYEIVGSDPYTGDRVSVDRRRGDPVENLVNFTALLVAAGDTVEIQNSPQVDFRADKLKVARSISPSFTIDDIKVGTRTLFAASGGAAAEIFDQDSTDAIISSFTATTAMTITLTVTNISVAAANFRATLLGRALA